MEPFRLHGLGHHNGLALCAEVSPHIRRKYGHQIRGVVRERDHDTLVGVHVDRLTTTRRGDIHAVAATTL